MVTVATLVRNEADRFLQSWLEIVPQFADRIVVCDDGSTDDSADMCEAAGCEVIRGDWHMQGNEWVARKALWDAAVPGSEWIVHIDADQIPAGDFRPHLEGKRVGFVVYDLWDGAHYRVDGPWTAHERHWWHAVNVADHQDHDWVWRKRGWHSGHLPRNVDDITPDVTPIPKECGLLHYAYFMPELRKEKFKMYTNLLPHLDAFEREHVLSIRSHAIVDRLPFTPTWRLKFGRR